MSPEEGCEACGAMKIEPEIEHGPFCTAKFTGSCQCKGADIPFTLTQLDYHGRKLMLCESCYAKERAILEKGILPLHEYQKNVPDRIEHRIKQEMKEFDTVAHYQELYTTERKQWVVENFSSIEEMRNKLTEFILSVEKLEWEGKTKKRAAYDSARELDTRMSKEDRDKLINDPNFKVPTNAEFKKIAKDRELDESVKTLGVTLTAQQRKSFDSLLKMGFSIEDIKAQMKL